MVEKHWIYYYNALIFSLCALFVCLFSVQLCSAMDAWKQCTLIDKALGRILMGLACDYLPHRRLSSNFYFRVWNAILSQGLGTLQPFQRSRPAHILDREDVVGQYMHMELNRQLQHDRHQNCVLQTIHEKNRLACFEDTLYFDEAAFET